LENTEEIEPLPPCCPYFIAVDISELPSATHENYEWIIPPVFAEVGSFVDDHVAVQKCCRFGIIDTQGEIIMPFIYEGFVREDEKLNVMPFERFAEHGIIAAKQNGRWGVINFAGESLVPFEYDDVNINYGRGLATARVGGVRDSGRTSALIEIATGREIVPTGKYQSIRSFAFTQFDNDLAHVIANNLHGAICTVTGETVIPAQYQEIRSPFRSTDFLLARGDRRWILYNFRGERIRTFAGGEIPVGATAFYATNDFDVRNERILFNPRERNAFVLDLDGNEVIPPIYNSIMLTTWNTGENKASENRAIVWTEEEHGIICIITGDIVLLLRPISNTHLSLGLYDENTAVIVEAVGFEGREMEFTFIDIATNTEIPRPEGFRNYREPRSHGNVPYELIYNHDCEYETLIGINDLQGNEIFPPTLSNVRRFGENLVRICDRPDETEYMWQSRLFDFTTWEEILPRHDFIDLPNGGGYSTRGESLFDEGLALINQGSTFCWQRNRRGGNWGVISDTGEIIIPAIMNFEYVRYESNDIFAVQRDGKWGFIRLGGL